VYKEVKDELMRFAETAAEKTARVRTEWLNFSKTCQMVAKEFRTK